MTPWPVSTWLGLGVEIPNLETDTRIGMGLSMSGAPPACHETLLKARGGPCAV